jgi:hypothetical protein
MPKRKSPSPEAIERFKQALIPEIIKLIQKEKAEAAKKEREDNEK